jgi:hypothetical protein
MAQQLVPYGPLIRNRVKPPRKSQERHYDVPSAGSLGANTKQGTISHAQTKRIHLFPVLKSLRDCFVLEFRVVSEIMIMLEVMPNEKLAFALEVKECAESERMDRAPEECVEEVQRDGCGRRRRGGEECVAGGVEDYEKVFRVGCTVRRMSDRARTGRGGKRTAEYRSS